MINMIIILCFKYSFFDQIIILFMFDHTNPEVLSTQLIYNYDKKLNQTWNMSEYKTPAAYLDPAKQVK